MSNSVQLKVIFVVGNPWALIVFQQAQLTANFTIGAAESEPREDGGSESKNGSSGYDPGGNVESSRVPYKKIFGVVFILLGRIILGESINNAGDYSYPDRRFVLGLITIIVGAAVMIRMVCFWHALTRSHGDIQVRDNRLSKSLPGHDPSFRNEMDRHVLYARVDHTGMSHESIVHSVKVIMAMTDIETTTPDLPVAPATEPKKAKKAAAKPKKAAQPKAEQPKAKRKEITPSDVRARTKFPASAKLKVLSKEDPTREGTASSAYWGMIRASRTFGDYRAAGGSTKYLYWFADRGLAQIGD